MDPEEAARLLEGSGRGHAAAVRGVGYIALTRYVGWAELERLFTDAESFRFLRQSYAEAGFDPDQVKFTEDSRPYLEEVVRTGYHPHARRAVLKLLEEHPTSDDG